MEIKKYIKEDLELIKWHIENQLDDNLKKIVSISLKNIERIEKVEVSCKNYEFDFHIIFYKDAEGEEDFIIMDTDTGSGIHDLNSYSNFLMDMYSQAMSNRLVDIVYSTDITTL